MSKQSSGKLLAPPLSHLENGDTAESSSPGAVVRMEQAHRVGQEESWGTDRVMRHLLPPQGLSAQNVNKLSRRGKVSSTHLEVLYKWE